MSFSSLETRQGIFAALISIPLSLGMTGLVLLTSGMVI